MKKENQKNGCRRISRLYSVLALYQMHHSNGKLNDVINDFLSEDNRKNPQIENISIDEMNISLFKELLESASVNEQIINNEISNCISKNWNMQRIDPVILDIIRLGVCEILFFSKIPSKVIFNEYTEIAKAFCEQKDVSFVNGILNFIARKNRPNDIFNDKVEK